MGGGKGSRRSPKKEKRMGRRPEERDPPIIERRGTGAWDWEIAAEGVGTKFCWRDLGGQKERRTKKEHGQGAI